MIRFFTIAAAACLLAVSPALAAHHGGHPGGNPHVSRSVMAHHGNGNNRHVSRTVRTMHVNVVRGGHERRTVTRMTTMRHVNGRAFARHRTVARVTINRHVNGRAFARHRAIVHVTINRRVNNRAFTARHTAVNIRSFRRNIHATRHFHAGVYRAPSGYHYRRWSFGQRLPSIYFVRDYWITDYSSYELMDPPDGYVWVRYGDDALLIDENSGEIVQVDYDVFD